MWAHYRAQGLVRVGESSRPHFPMTDWASRKRPARNKINRATPLPARLGVEVSREQDRLGERVGGLGCRVESVEARAHGLEVAARRDRRGRGALEGRLEHGEPEVLAAVYDRTAKQIKEPFAHVPEELRLKKVELNRAETRVDNLIEFIAQVARLRGSPTRSARQRKR